MNGQDLRDFSCWNWVAKRDVSEHLIADLGCKKRALTRRISRLLRGRGTDPSSRAYGMLRSATKSSSRSSILERVSVINAISIPTSRYSLSPLLCDNWRQYKQTRSYETRSTHSENQNPLALWEHVFQDLVYDHELRRRHDEVLAQRVWCRFCVWKNVWAARRGGISVSLRDE